LKYIEDNLRGDIDFNIIASKSCLSKFCYNRMFQFVTGLTRSEYIRNRKMSLAVKETKESGPQVEYYPPTEDDSVI